MHELLNNPFNRLIGLIPGDGPGTIFALPESPNYTNHLGTIHAAAQFALAEATSGACLLEALGTEFPEPFAVVRRVEGKFRDPLRGRIQSKGSIEPGELAKCRDALVTKRRALVSVNVEIVDESGAVGLRARVEWFVRLAETVAEEPAAG